MKSNIRTNFRVTRKQILACVAAGWLGCTAGTSYAQAPADITPALARVVTFAKGGMSDDFIQNYITSSGATFTLSDDDIIYLHKEGVSDSVIKALMQTAAAATPPPAASPGAAPSTPTPPPLDASPSPAPSSPPPGAPADPGPSSPPPMSAPPQPALQDNFFADGGLNPALWVTQSGTLSALASLNGRQVLPELSFSPSGMQMMGIREHERFMGIQSAMSFVPPFNFSVTVTGMAQEGVPFEVYLVSADLQQWVSLAGHLGGRGGPRGGVDVGGGFGHVFGDVRIPFGGRSPDYGFWVNHTGSGFPISALGYKVFEDAIAGVPYTVQVSASPDGAANVTLLNSGGAVLAAQNVPVGMGPFYVILAGRDGRTYANWQSVQLTPAAPPAPAPAPVAEAAPVVPPVPTMDYFQSQLTPYGTWVNLPGYGMCWQPSVDPGWRPYYDGGSWQLTDAGWYWQSEYPWGDIAFHYGRWAYTAVGWAWVPGYEYAPSWVVWRHADDAGALGWAPLPPGAIFVDGGWRYNGLVVGADFDFGLGPAYFTFVPNDHFWDHDYRLWIVPRDRVDFYYHHSMIENHYRMDHGVYINVGIGRDRIAVLTHRDARDIRVVDHHEIRRNEEMHHAEARRDDIRSFHPGQHPDARGASAHRAGEPEHRAGEPEHRAGEPMHNAGGPNRPGEPNRAGEPYRGPEHPAGNEHDANHFAQPAGHPAAPSNQQKAAPQGGSNHGGNQKRPN